MYRKNAKSKRSIDWWPAIRKAIDSTYSFFIQVGDWLFLLAVAIALVGGFVYCFFILPFPWTMPILAIGGVIFVLNLRDNIRGQSDE